MWIRLLKSYKHKDKKYPIGQILNVSSELFKTLTREKRAEAHIESLPPKNKIKTDFFKQK